jgi:hypothetical protein
MVQVKCNVGNPPKNMGHRNRAIQKDGMNRPIGPREIVAASLLVLIMTNPIPAPANSGTNLAVFAAPSASYVSGDTTFDPVQTTQLRLEVDGNGEFSTGLLEWRVRDAGDSPHFTRMNRLREKAPPSDPHSQVWIRDH